MLINTSRLVQLFCDLVRIDSPSFGEERMAKRLIAELKSLGFRVEQDDAGKAMGSACGNVFAYLDGEGEPLLFCAHMDTVEPSKNKQAVIHDDGVITSAGDTILGADDCAGLAAILEAARSLLEQNVAHRPIEILFTIAEEVYGKGVALADISRIRSKEAYVLDLTGPVGTAAFQAPTILLFTVEILGKAAHAGFAPERGIHSVFAAAQAISQLRMGRLDEQTTLNIGLIEGGIASNIVPEHCTIRGEIRSLSDEKAHKQADLVKEVFEEAAKASGATAQFNLQVGCPAYNTPVDRPVVKRFIAACTELGLQGEILTTFGASDYNYLASYGIEGIVLANAMSNCHSLQEYTTISELEKAASLARLLMQSEPK